MILNIYFFVLLYYRKIVIPSVRQEPSFSIQNGRIVIQILVSSLVEPQMQWSFGGKKIAQGGRYSYKAVKQGGDYCVMLEMNEVSAGSQGFAGAHKGSRGSQVGRYSYKAVKQGGDYCGMLEMNEVSEVSVAGPNPFWVLEIGSAANL